MPSVTQYKQDGILHHPLRICDLVFSKDSFIVPSIFKLVIAFCVQDTKNSVVCKQNNPNIILVVKWSVMQHFGIGDSVVV